MHLPPGERHGEEIVYTCPSCHAEKKFWWNPAEVRIVDGNRLVGAGNCFKCGFRIRGVTRFRQVFGSTDAPSSEFRPVVRIPNREEGEWSPISGHLEAMNYLQARNVSLALAKEVGVQWNGKEIRVPIWSPLLPAGEWMRRGIKSKGWFADDVKKGLYLFGDPNTNLDRQAIYLVEGVFDLLSPGLWGKGFALLGSNLSRELEQWLVQVHPPTIYIWFDADETGFKKGPELCERLSRWHPKTHLILGWAGDFRDPGEYDPVEAKKMILASWLQAKPQPIWREISLK